MSTSDTRDPTSPAGFKPARDCAVGSVMMAKKIGGDGLWEGSAGGQFAAWSAELVARADEDKVGYLRSQCRRNSLHTAISSLLTCDQSPKR